MSKYDAMTPRRHWRQTRTRAKCVSAHCSGPAHVKFEDIGEPWVPEDVHHCRRQEMVQVARFMTGHCHLGSFCILWENYSEDCLLCGELYSRVHFLTECVALSDLRSRWLVPSAWGRSGLQGLVWRDCSRFGHFLLGVRDLILSLDIFHEED